MSDPMLRYVAGALLCAVVAVVYKTTKFDQPREIARAALHFFVSVSLGMLALALGFYLFQTLFC